MKPKTPVIFRFGWANGNDDLRYGQAQCLGFTSLDPSDTYFHDLELELPPDQPVDEFTFYCWIAIPTSNWTDREFYEKDFTNTCLQKLSTDLAKIFRRVGGDQQASEPVREMTLAIVDPKTEEVGRRFTCNAEFLAVRSSMFATMFSQPWEEGRNRVVEIKDVNEKTMELILQYIYTGKCPPYHYLGYRLDKLKDILYAAEKYDLDLLKQWCMAHLIQRYNSDQDLIEQLQVADRYRLPQLEAVCLASLSTHLGIFKNREMREKISDDIWSKLVTLGEKNMWKTTEICVEKRRSFS